MSHNVQVHVWNKGLCLSFILPPLIIILFACSSKHKNVDELINSDISPSRQISKADSITMRNAYSRTARIDTITSNMGCSMVFKYYDKYHNLLLLESRQNCQDDLRLIMESKIFFGEMKDTQVKFSFDGMGNVVEVLKWGEEKNR